MRGSVWTGRAAAPGLAIVIAGVVLLLCVTLNVVTLRSEPPLHSDEAWLASSIWSLLDGGTMGPTVIRGVGVVDDGPNMWQPKAGSFHLILAGLADSDSLITYRIAALLVGLAALAVFIATLRRETGTAVALAATAGLAISYGFWTASHYVRWDSLAILMTTALMAHLMRGPPTLRAAIVAGLLLGLASDVQFSVLAGFPAALMLVGWERDGRWRRMGAMSGAAGLVIAAVTALRTLPDRDLSRLQYDALYGDSYTIPLSKALSELSLGPLLDEWDRYRLWFSAPFEPPFITPVGVGLMFLAAAAMAGIALGVWSVRARTYPRAAVPVFLLVSHLLGIALIAGNRATLMPAWFALPYAFATMALVAVAVSRRLSPLVPTLVFSAFAVGLAVLAIRDARQTPDQPPLDKGLERQLRAATQGAGTVMGEHTYWFAFRDDRLRSNSNIYLQQTVQGGTFEEAFAAVCPDALIYDDTWRSRFPPARQTAFPTLAPSDPADQQRLEAILAARYRRVLSTVVDGTRVAVWRRTTTACA